MIRLDTRHYAAGLLRGIPQMSLFDPASNGADGFSWWLLSRLAERGGIYCCSCYCWWAAPGLTIYHSLNMGCSRSKSTP